MNLLRDLPGADCFLFVQHVVLRRVVLEFLDISLRNHVSHFNRNDVTVLKDSLPFGALSIAKTL